MPNPFTIYASSFQRLFANFSVFIRFFGILALILAPLGFLRGLVFQYQFLQLFQQFGIRYLPAHVELPALIQNQKEQIIETLSSNQILQAFSNLSLAMIITVAVVVPLLLTLFYAFVFLSKWTAAAVLETSPDSISARSFMPHWPTVGKFALAHLLQTLLGLGIIAATGMLLTVMAFVFWPLLFLSPIILLVVSVLSFIIFWIWLIFVGPAVFVDRIGPIDALRTSYRLARGNEGRLFATAFLFFATFFLTGTILSPLNALSSFEPIISTLVTVFSFLVNTGVSLASYIGIVKWYQALKEEPAPSAPQDSTDI